LGKLILLHSGPGKKTFQPAKVSSGCRNKKWINSTENKLILVIGWSFVYDNRTGILKRGNRQINAQEHPVEWPHAFHADLGSKTTLFIKKLYFKPMNSGYNFFSFLLLSFTGSLFSQSKGDLYLFNGKDL